MGDPLAVRKDNGCVRFAVEYAFKSPGMIALIRTLSGHREQERPSTLFYYVTDRKFLCHLNNFCFNCNKNKLSREQQQRHCRAMNNPGWGPSSTLQINPFPSIFSPKHRLRLTFHCVVCAFPWKGRWWMGGRAEVWEKGPEPNGFYFSGVSSSVFWVT